MNRSSTQPANAPGLRTRLRQLLHAFAEAGRPSAIELQLFMGPNGGLIWTDSAQVDRSEPYAGDVFSTSEKSAVAVESQSPTTIRLHEPAETPVYAPLEAPVSS